MGGGGEGKWAGAMGRLRAAILAEPPFDSLSLEDKAHLGSNGSFST